MCTAKTPICTLALAIVAVLLAGCSVVAPTENGQVSIAPNGPFNGISGRQRGTASGRGVATSSFFDPNAKGKPLIFISTYHNNVVDIDLQAGNHKMVGQIANLNLPKGLATDTARNLYVVNTPGEVLVYAPPYTGAPTSRLDDTGYYDGDVSVSRLGIVAIANACEATASQACDGPGSVTFYAKNGTTPCATITEPTKFAYIDYDAFDRKGNLYITGADSTLSVDSVGEIQGGCKAKKITPLTTPDTLVYPGPIKIDKFDRIAVVGAQNGSNQILLDTYNQPVMGKLGNPVSSIPLIGVGIANDLVFVASGSDFYAGDNVYKTVNEFRYPSGDPVGTNITGPDNAGLAVTPTLIP
jgi:hypothetical protein